MNEVPLTGLPGYNMPKEYAIGNVTIKEDGIPDTETLTGFLEKKYYREITPQSIFSDHALIRYPSEQIATFNIADKMGYIEQRNADGKPILGSNGKPEIATDPISRNQLILHKFPLKQEQLKFKEINTVYRKRVGNNIRKCLEYLNDGRASVIALQETLPNVFTTELRTLDPGNKYKYIHLQTPPKDLLILYNPNERNLVQTELLLPSKFENSTGMKAPMNTTLTATLKKRILVCKDEAKKELLFNVHIPGLDLEKGPVEERRENTLKLLLEIKKKYTEKPEFNGYSFLFIGDFNVPLVADTQSTKDVYNTIGYPMEIHTTVGNEGFSYVDNNRTRTPANIDCLVKIPPIGGGPAAPLAVEPSARRLRFANEDGLPLTTTENNGAIESIPTENRDENNEEENKNEKPLSELVAANTSLPTILRIGNGGKFDEFINTTEKTFTSSGGFSILHKGGQKELQELYSVRDADRLVVLQKAFGVKRLSDKPPLMAVLEQGCTPDYDVNAVDQALESRIDTLEAELASMTETTQKGMKRAFLKVLEELLVSVRGLPKDTPCPPSKGSAGPGPVAGPVAEPKPSGCPCLDDIDLLRDLIMLVVTLMGVANPQVKAQLEEVRLDDILELLDSGNSASATVRLREVLATLSNLEAAAGNGAGGDGNLQEILAPIWRVLTPGDEVPEVLTVAVILNTLKTVLDSSKSNLDGLKSRIAALVREIDRKETEVKDLQRQLNEYRVAGDAGIAATSELAAARATLAEKEAELAAVTARSVELTQAFGAAGAVAGETARRQEARLADLQGQLAAAQEAQRTAQDTVTRLQSELVASQAQTGAVTAERDTASTEVARVTQELEQKNAEITRLNERLSSLGTEKATLEAQVVAGNKNVQSTLADKSAEIATLQTKLDECTREKDASEIALTAAKALLDEKETEIAAIKARAETAEKGSALKNTAAEAVAAQLAQLTANLAAVTAELEALRTSQAEAEAAIAAEKERLSQQAAELEGIIPGLNAQIAALKTSGAAAETRATKAEAQVVRLQAELTSAKEGLANATQEHEAEKAAAEIKKLELTTQLGALEGRIRATEEAADTLTGESSTKDAELTQLRADKVTLQAELDALKAKGPEQAAALAVAEAEFKRQIATCQDALAALRTEKNAALSAKNAELAAQKAAHEKTIAELQAQIAEAESKATKAETNASGQIAAAQANRNAKVAEAKAEAEAAKTKTKEELNAVVAGASAKNAEITKLKEKLAAAEKAKQDCDKALAEKQSELDEISASLPVPGEIEAQAALKAAEIQKNTAEKEGLRAQITQLESDIASLQLTLASVGSPTEETEAKLNTLLSVILVDPELKEEAKKYMKSGDDANLEQLKAKKIDAGILSPELCDFYTYLYGLISLQSKKLPPRLQPDILQKFKNPPTADKNKQLLKEIALIFQAFFIMGETNTAPADLTVSADVPEIYTFLTSLEKQPLKDEIQRNSFAREVSGTGFLSQLALVPVDGTQKVKLVKIGPNYITEFVEENTTHMIPLSIFAIKLIQLLHSDLNEKYFDIRKKCGMTATFERNVIAAVATDGQKGGGDDSNEIEFEEFTL